MLTYEMHGPNAAGQFLVIYRTPGCNVPTVAEVCTTLQQAQRGVQRLNAAQIERERVLRQDRQLRGLGGAYPGLEA